MGHSVRPSRLLLALALASPAACSVETESLGDPDEVDGKGDAVTRNFCSEADGDLPTKYRGIPIEGPTGYVARALACEADDDAEPEYLKALAVSIRSIAIMGAHEKAPCGDSCQPLCKRDIRDAHVQAVAETEGEFLWYGDYPIFGFHTVGTADLDVWCMPQSEVHDRSTPWNGCQTGDDVQRSRLGRKVYDRGALNHDSAECLAELGEDYVSILRRHYGEDIGIGCGEAEPPRDECTEGEPDPPAPNPDGMPDPYPDPDPTDPDDPDDPDDGSDPEPEDPEQNACSIDNDRPSAAELLPDEQTDSFWNWGYDYERTVPPGAEAWFRYRMTDTGDPSDVTIQATVWDNDPKFIPELPNLSVCEYFTCDEGTPVIAEGGCGGGDRDNLTLDGRPAAGCCHGNFGAVAVEINDASCSLSGGDVAPMNGEVWVSVEQDSDRCEENIWLELDLD